MSKSFLIFVFLLSLSSFSQKATEHEKEILQVINSARTSPQEFLENVVFPYIEQNGLRSNSYVRSLIRDLKQQKALTPLTIDSSLQEMAKQFAVKSGKRGQYGHGGYSHRFDTYGSHLNYDGENIQYGIEDPKEIVVDLLIDEGVRSLGHRKNIMSSDFSVIGIGFAEHKAINFNTVMAFGGF